MIASFCSLNEMMLYTKSVKGLFRAHIHFPKMKRGTSNLFNGSNFSFQTKLQTYEYTKTVTSFELNQNLFFNRSNLFLNKKVVF